MHDSFRLSDPDERDLAAGEYVLGTLEAPQRAEFEALLAVSPDLQASVDAWREHLQLLNQQLTPVSPPQRLWPEIAQRLGLRTGLLQRLGFWRTISGVATAAALALAVMALAPREPAMMPGEYVFVINQPNGQPAWILNATLNGKMMVQAVAPGPMPVGKGGELWMMENGTPVSLGMLPTQGQATMQLPAKMLNLMKTADFAVSMEPSAGAPGGKPSGPVIDEGKLVQIRGNTVSL
ncbi:anti-sigma factor [Salinicola avicenniae]|uniref:anti-sigma factor n=1 Tax=Salinicola avicenniae TaxID=2916836 RepID=UPI0020747958|nr:MULTISPECIES: anti-sigma factor [unclassified Salinicola]